MRKILYTIEEKQKNKGIAAKEMQKSCQTTEEKQRITKRITKRMTILRKNKAYIDKEHLVWQKRDKEIHSQKLLVNLMQPYAQVSRMYAIPVTRRGSSSQFQMLLL